MEANQETSQETSVKHQDLSDGGMMHVARAQDQEEEEEEEEENSFTIRRTKSGSIKDTLMYAVPLSASSQALDALVLESGPEPEPHTISASPSRNRTKAKSKLQLVACTGLECEVMDLRNGQIFLPPFAKTSVRFEWTEPPERALVVIKPGERATEDALLEAAAVLRGCGVRVHVEQAVMEALERRGNAPEGSGRLTREAADLASRFELWVPGTHHIDFIVTLGGDGTVLWVSSLFPRGVPPVLSFAMGTLGFLTSFPFSHHEQHLNEVCRGDRYLSLRTRMRCKLYSYHHGRHQGREGGGASASTTVSREELVGTYIVLNEVSVNRSPSSNLVDIDLFCDGVPVTKVQADGVLVSTPTGSTAYSLAAGGSVVHPAVSAMLLTPICPHSLSFRPLLFPDAVTLQLQIPHLSRGRGTCVVAFDGKHKFEMGPGDCVTIQVRRRKEIDSLPTLISPPPPTEFSLTFDGPVFLVSLTKRCPHTRCPRWCARRTRRTGSRA